MFAALIEKLHAARGPDGGRGGRRPWPRSWTGARAAGADRRPARRPGDEGRAAGRDRRASRGRCARSAVPLPRVARPVFDTCGTGGDRARHVQHLDRRGARASRRAACGSRSTATARCRAGAAAPTCSRRSASTSRAAPAVVERCLDEAGIAFFFAPTFHPSMRHAGADAARARRADGVQPARPADQSRPARARQLVGVPRPELTELVARSLALLGSERAWVVHGADGLDEISTTGYTKVSECRDGAVQHVLRAPGGRRPAEGRAGGARGRRRGRQRAPSRARARRRARAPRATSCC